MGRSCIGIWRLAEHLASGAEVTLAVMPCYEENIGGFGAVRVDETGRIVEFREKPRDAAARGAEVIVWPESSVPGFVDVDPVLRRVSEQRLRRQASVRSVRVSMQVPDDGATLYGALKMRKAEHRLCENATLAPHKMSACRKAILSFSLFAS